MARRGENIRKRKDGRWEGRYIKARTSEGKIQWGYVYGTVYAEVKRVLIQKKAEAGFYKLKRTDLTFEALAEVWLHSLRNSIKESTYAHYSYTLHKYLLPVLSKAPVASLEESFLEQAMQQIIVPTDAAHTPLGNSSARECLSMLRRIHHVQKVGVILFAILVHRLVIINDNGRLTEVVGVGLHGQAVDADDTGLLVRRVILVLFPVAVVARHLEHPVCNEIFAGAVGLHDGLDEIFRHILVVGEELLGIFRQAVAAARCQVLDNFFHK